jgi:hypothetical protein
MTFTIHITGYNVFVASYRYSFSGHWVCNCVSSHMVGDDVATDTLYVLPPDNVERDHLVLTVTEGDNQVTLT